jgi:hypothetical protein
MDERDKKDEEERADAGQAAEDPEALEDLDVPEGESEDVKGGYSFKQAWPKKYEGL